MALWSPSTAARKSWRGRTKVRSKGGSPIVWLRGRALHILQNPTTAASLVLGSVCLLVWWRWGGDGSWYGWYLSWWYMASLLEGGFSFILGGPTDSQLVRVRMMHAIDGLSRLPFVSAAIFLIILVTGLALLLPPSPHHPRLIATLHEKARGRGPWLVGSSLLLWKAYDEYRKANQGWITAIHRWVWGVSGVEYALSLSLGLLGLLYPLLMAMNGPPARRTERWWNRRGPETLPQPPNPPPTPLALQ